MASLFPISLKVVGVSQSKEFVLFQSLTGILLSAICFCYFRPENSIFSFFKAIQVGPLSTLAALVILLILAISLIVLKNSEEFISHQFPEKTFLLINSALGLILLAWSNDLLVSFIALEYTSIAFYVLVAIGKDLFASREASLKYFLSGAFMSIILLYGLSWIYGASGTTNLSALSAFLPDLFTTSRVFVIGIFLFICGLFFKLSLFPFHFWLADVYEGTLSALVGYMASVLKLAVFLVLFKIVFLEMDAKTTTFVDILSWISVLSIFAGSVAALVQSSLKRVLAFSSVAHAGFILIGVVATTRGSVEASFIATLYYLLSYAIMILTAFICIHILEKRLKKNIFLEDLKGLFFVRPYFSGGFAVVLISLAGLPPTIGFFSKFLVFSVALQEELFWLSIWAILGSVVALYYYFKPIQLMFTCAEEKTDEIEKTASIKKEDLSTQSLFWIGVLASGILGIFSDPIYQMLEGLIKL